MKKDIKYFNEMEGATFKRVDPKVSGNAMVKNVLSVNLATVLKIDRKYITKDRLTKALTIIQGMVWSEEFENAASSLASKIDEEFISYVNGANEDK